MIATFDGIRQRRVRRRLRIADLLLDDDHDLIHKAVGWLLREVGKRDGAAERAFLATRYKRMPRTMLRYAIEKFPERRATEVLRGRRVSACLTDASAIRGPVYLATQRRRLVEKILVPAEFGYPAKR